MKSKENLSVKPVFTVRGMVHTSIFAALTAVSAYFVIPLGPVPITGQTLMVMLAGFVLGAYRGALSQIVYILLGVIGLPVFSGGSSGVGILAGPTGGFIWGFVVGAFVIGLITEVSDTDSPLILVTTLVAGGLLVIYTTGIIQYMLVAGVSFTEALSVAVLPFIPGGILKVIAAFFIGRKLKPALERG
ncbi:MAG: biotin transporter BioY [Halanaerobiaceae bacterium]